MTSINFVPHGYKLTGNLFMPNAPKGLAFLFIQGWMGHQNLKAALALADLGYPTMTYDMRGNGESESNVAELRRADFVEDSAVAYDYFSQQIGDNTRIGVIGSGFGGYTAVPLSEKRNIHCLSIRVPATYPDKGFNQPQLAQKITSKDFIKWRKQELDYTQNYALSALHNFTGKVQIIEAGADELVPSQAPKNYANAVADKSQLTCRMHPTDWSMSSFGTIT